MSGELLADGDRPPHLHDLPDIPKEWRKDGWYKLENAVASCGVCGRLFVSREDPDGWGRQVIWVPLRWWHFKARRKLSH